MNKSTFTFFLSFVFLFIQSSALQAKTVEVVVQGVNCSNVNEMHIYEFDGLGFHQAQTTVKNENDEFVFKVKTKNRIFRYVGVEVGKFKSVVLGDEDKVVLKGNCGAFNKATVAEGLNHEYNTMMNTIRSYAGTEKSIGSRFARGYRDPVKKKALTEEYAVLDQKKRDLIQSYAEKNKWLGEVAKLYTYFSFQNSGTDLPNEVEYFGQEYFGQADLGSDAYDNMPLLFDVNEILTMNLDKLPKDSDAKKMALGGTLSGLKAASNPLFISYARSYIDQYCEDSPACKNLETQIKNVQSLVVGAVAPEFTMMNLEGEPVNLSDFRGKVLLIDFWASWCGPCRRDNPHVVELYNKYKEDGFEILGVSLDKTKSKWEQAVAKDNLTWSHVSDLKGWKNEVALTYSVKSIPDTVLLDKEGKIIARKLRGPSLDQKLASIFGH